MAGRILNRQARTKILYNLLAVAESCMSRDGLAGVMAVAEVALEPGQDIEKVRQACNARRLVLLDAKQKARKAIDVFTK